MVALLCSAVWIFKGHAHASWRTHDDVSCDETVVGSVAHTRTAHARFEFKNTSRAFFIHPCKECFISLGLCPIKFLRNFCTIGVFLSSPFLIKFIKCCESGHPLVCSFHFPWSLTYVRYLSSVSVLRQAFFIYTSR